MNFRENIKNLKKRITNRFANININPISDVEPTPDFGSSRTSLPKTLIGGGGAFGALPKRVQRDLSLDDRRFTNLTIPNMIDALIDAHPDVSYAVWNYLRIGNTPYEIIVERLGSGKRWVQAERDIHQIFENLDLPNVDNYESSRSLSKVINQMLLSAVIRGAVACELVLSQGLDDVAFIAPVDPATIEFRIQNDRYVPSQDNERIILDIPTFFYEGLDERIDDPYGRSPIISALNIVVFQLQVLNDIKAVVHNHGYPRVDIKIIEEVLLNRMPITIRNNEKKKQEWLRDRMSEIINMYSGLEPDDAFVHFDSIQIDTTGGNKSGGAMIDPEKLMNAIDNLIMTGLKTLSTILGRRSTGNTESFAKLEIKLYIQGVRAMQEVVERILSKALTLALNIKGKQGVVKFRFKPVEIRTDLEKEQMKQTKLLNLQFMYNMGWISHEEASYEAVGHAPVAPQPLINQTPKNQEGQDISGTTDENPRAGGNNVGD
jgi:hypothetical protein